MTYAMCDTEIKERIEKLKLNLVESIVKCQGTMLDKDFSEKLGIKKTVYSKIKNSRLNGHSIEWLIRLNLKVGGKSVALKALIKK